MRLNLEREVELNRLKEGKDEDVRDRRRKGEIEERVIQLERSLADLNKKANELRRKWSFEKSTLNEISRIRQQIVLEENNLSSLILLGD